jgi:hypothetical protein
MDEESAKSGKSYDYVLFWPAPGPDRPQLLDRLGDRSPVSRKGRGSQSDVAVAGGFHDRRLDEMAAAAESPETSRFSGHWPRSSERSVISCAIAARASTTVDAGVAAGDLQRDHTGGEGLPELRNP